MALATFLQNVLLNATLKNVAYTPLHSGVVWIGIHTTNPTISTSVALSNEVVGNGYTRQIIPFGSPTNGIITTNSGILFPAATPAGWGNIGYISIWDSVTVGNMLYFGPTITKVSIVAGDQAQILAGTLSIRVQ